MPVSGPMAGSGRRPWRLPFGSGCTRNVARPSSSARMKSRPRSACCQFSHHHVFQLFVQEFFGGLFELRIDFDEIGQHAERLEVVRPCPFRATANSRFTRFGGVGAMRQHLLERFLARADLARPRSSAPSISRRSSAASWRRSARSSSVRRRSPVTDSSSIWRCATVSESCLRAPSSRSISAAATCFFARGAGGFALDSGQVLFDLRQLVPQRGGLAQQPQDHLPAGLRWRFSRSRTLTCNASRC